MSALWGKFKQKSVRVKIFVYVAGLILFTVVTILLVVNFQVRSNMQNVLVHDLRGVHNVLMEYEHARLELLKNKAMLLSEEPRLKAALDTGDPATVRREAEKFVPIIETDFLVLCDAAGRLLANFSDLSLPRNLTIVPAIHGALAGGQTVAIYSGDSTFSQMIASPVSIMDPQGNVILLGAVTIGLIMQDSVLNALSRLTDCTVGFVRRQNGEQPPLLQFSAELNPRDISPLEKTNLLALKADPQVQTVQIGGQDYLVIATPFFAGEPAILLLLMTSLDETLRPILLPTRQALLIIGLVALLLSLAFSYWLARGISSPIIQLVKAAKIVSQGDLQTPINVKARDEIGVLADSFEEMRQSLQRNMDNLQKTYARLMVSEKLATTGKLMAHLSHELNNPIHNIRSALEAGLKKLTQSEREMIDIAHEEILRLERLVRQTLDFYRPGGGERTRVDVNELLAEMAAVSRDSLRKKNIAIQTRLAENLTPVSANRDQLKQVFLNLLLNAGDAMPNGGAVVLETQNDNNHVVVRVRDTGVGIPPDKQDKIFDAFYTTKSGVSGVGLGLSVSYEIINQHGGQIGLNTEYRDGAEFYVILPVDSGAR